ncbi:NADase-type glycan-binding domain-containing protein [Clostridium baratii]|uniref:NADase-type glycan-binding domain-containing protein n=1 Tax=Clostridium baratii TaxID=1561 RepID=UPI003D3394BA
MVKISTKTKKIVAIIIVVLCVITIASELTIEMISNKAKIKAEEEIKKSLAKGDDKDKPKASEENNKDEEKTNSISKDDSNNPKETEKSKKKDEDTLDRTLPIYKVYASSVLEDGTGVDYSPYNLIDRKSNTIWAEGAEGPGIEQFIRIDFNKDKVVKKLYIINGSAKSERLYYANNRVRVLRLDFGDGEIKDFELQDGVMGEQEIDLGKGIKTPYVGMTIYDVYYGNKYDDTCISEIRAVGYDSDEKLQPAKI